MSRSRVLSVVVTGAYVMVSLWFGGARAATKILAFCTLPCACIWFPEERGNYVGGYITQPSPAAAVRVVGWIVLFAPVVAGVLMWVASIGVVPKMSWRDGIQAWGSLRRR